MLEMTKLEMIGYGVLVQDKIATPEEINLVWAVKGGYLDRSS